MLDCSVAFSMADSLTGVKTVTDKQIFQASRYELILDSLSEGVCTVDRSWTITSFNRAAQELTGVSSQEAIGLHFGDVFPV